LVYNNPDGYFTLQPADENAKLQPGSNVEILLAGPMGNHSGKIISGD
jgi:hypothetical protein